MLRKIGAFLREKLPKALVWATCWTLFATLVLRFSNPLAGFVVAAGTWLVLDAIFWPHWED
jgi:hypothetical protein